jgi:cysteine desulfurase
MNVYLDHNATTPIRPEAAEAVVRAMQMGGNPSAVHESGRAARRVVEEAREAVAALVGADPAGVIFTSGGTEANALALKGLRRPRILASAIEHSSILKQTYVEHVPVDTTGVVDLLALDEMLKTRGEPALVALMLANNETGVIQPVFAAAELAHNHGAVLHCDAVQAAGRLEIDIRGLRATALTLSAHKIGGPAGVGALVLADPAEPLDPQLLGGAQEMRRRAGTENLAGIAGFGAAARVVKAVLAEEAKRLDELRQKLEGYIATRMADAVIFGEDAKRLPNTICVAVPGHEARTLVMALDLAGIAISAGAACSSGRIAPSHVLGAMGAGQMAASAIRISLGWNTTEADIDMFMSAFGRTVARLGFKPASAA